jgi:hypothetical protein
MSKSEHQVSCRDTTLRHNPEDLDLNLHRREKKKKNEISQHFPSLIFYYVLNYIYRYDFRNTNELSHQGPGEKFPDVLFSVPGFHPRADMRP